MKNLFSESDEKVTQDLMPRPFDKLGVMWLTILVLVCGIGLFAYIQQLRQGLCVTSLRDYASWGIYISNFVFFVAISLVGSLITAVLRLAGAHWCTPITRIAEIIAVSAISFAGLIIIVDMGRPERFYNLFIHGRLQSPIIWDVLVISTYLIISCLLLYLPLLPDLKIMIARTKDDPEKRMLHKMYCFMGSFWTGSPLQEKLVNRGINILCVTIVPVAFSIHTVTSWLFATTYRAGWDSSNFGAYFISGAFLVGSGAVMVATYVFRHIYHLEEYITHVHFDKLGRIVVMLAGLYGYFNVNEFLVPAFKMKKPESEFLLSLFVGDFSTIFWFAISIGMVVPILILITPKGRRPFPAFIAGICVVVGAWIKRYLIVTPTLLSPFLPMHDVPESFKHYVPSWVEWSIAFGSLAGALLIITIFARLFPIIPIHETIHEAHEKNNEHH